MHPETKLVKVGFKQKNECQTQPTCPPPVKHRAERSQEEDTHTDVFSYVFEKKSCVKKK